MGKKILVFLLLACFPIIILAEEAQGSNIRCLSIKKQMAILEEQNEKFCSSSMSQPVSSSLQSDEKKEIPLGRTPDIQISNPELKELSRADFAASLRDAYYKLIDNLIAILTH